MRELRWSFKAFDELSVHELYAMLKLRSQVFVVEQNCVFLDPDGTDDKAMHLLGWLDDELVAYTRNYDAGIKYKEASIGRVITSDKLRGKRYGPVLMHMSIKQLCAAFGAQPIRIGAQQRLTPFYESQGFVVASDSYIEDEIPHIEMLWTPTESSAS
jgi:ElaA protein